MADNEGNAGNTCNARSTRNAGNGNAGTAGNTSSGVSSVPSIDIGDYEIEAVEETVEFSILVHAPSSDNQEYDLRSIYRRYNTGMHSIATRLKHTMSLDDAMLKRNAGGPGVVITGRHCGSSSRFRFVWQAGFVLVFNEGDCPQFDTGDSAFIGRMLVAPMRAKFVEAGDGAAEEEWTYQVDPSISARFVEWTSALADVLVEHYGASAFDKIPPEMREWRHEIAGASNPVAEWCRDTLVVTGNADDTVSLNDVRPGVDDTYIRNVRAYFEGVQGVSYVKRTTLKTRVPKRHVLRGVQLAAQPGV